MSCNNSEKVVKGKCIACHPVYQDCSEEDQLSCTKCSEHADLIINSEGKTCK